jgi:hypothetical protein
MSNTTYLSIVAAFTTALMLFATFYRPEYGEFFYRLKQEQPKWQGAVGSPMAKQRFAISRISRWRRKLAYRPYWHC